MFNRTVGTALIALLTLFTVPSTASAETCGLASFYHEGTMTASGERFHPDGLTAAHRTLRHGTHLRVVSQRTHKEVHVRVNDYGPASWTGKTIDLSRGAARVLGMLTRGVDRVCYSITGFDLSPKHSHKHRHRVRHSHKN